MQNKKYDSKYNINVNFGKKFYEYYYKWYLKKSQYIFMVVIMKVYQNLLKKKCEKILENTRLIREQKK